MMFPILSAAIPSIYTELSKFGIPGIMLAVLTYFLIQMWKSKNHQEKEHRKELSEREKSFQARFTEQAMEFKESNEELVQQVMNINRELYQTMAVHTELLRSIERAIDSRN
jgi:hypothetical protein